MKLTYEAKAMDTGQLRMLYDQFLDEKRARRKAKKTELATLTQQVADYREALTYIAEVCSFGPPSAAKSECYKAARAVLDKYPTQLSKAKPR
jgi:hypothetical protein